MTRPWIVTPRPQDASARYQMHGPLLPMEGEPGPLGSLLRSMPFSEGIGCMVFAVAFPALVWGAAVMGP